MHYESTRSGLVAWWGPILLAWLGLGMGFTAAAQAPDKPEGERRITPMPAPAPIRDAAALELLKAAGRLQIPDPKAARLTSLKAEFSTTFHVTEKGEPTKPRAATIGWACRVNGSKFVCRRSISEMGIETVYIRANPNAHYLITGDGFYHLEARPSMASELGFFKQESQLLKRLLLLYHLPSVLDRVVGVRFLARDVQHVLDARRRKSVVVDEIEVQLRQEGSRDLERLHLRIGKEEPKLFRGSYFVATKPGQPDRKFSMNFSWHTPHPSDQRLVALQWEYLEDDRLMAVGGQSPEHMDRIQFNPDLPGSLFRKPRKSKKD